MTNPVDPETGAPLRRDVRPFTLTYKGQSITVDMPGWYGDQPDAGIFEPEDMKVSDRTLNRLKARTKGLPQHEVEQLITAERQLEDEGIIPRDPRRP